MGNTNETFTSFNSSMSQCYPNYGLSHSLDELEIMDKYIHYLPVHLQEKYADSVTRKNCSNEKWLEDQFKDLIPQDFNKLNATSVGNLAYISIHAPTQELRNKVGHYLQEYCNWRETLDKPSRTNDGNRDNSSSNEKYSNTDEKIVEEVN